MTRIDNGTSYVLISSKLKVKTVFPYRFILELPSFEYGCLVGLNIKDGTWQRQGALMSSHCLINHFLCNLEKRTVSGSSNLKAQQNVLC